jgi:mannose/cellobiose epimerase-like protein (N-acyl-D-glucosamine 2-epimerase family)
MNLPSPANSAAKKIGPWSVGELAERYRSNLFENFLPFLDRRIIDHELGGFRCNADRDGTLLSQNKTTWYEGRGIWVYSFLFNRFGQDPHHLEVAKKSVDLILKSEPQDPHGHWPRNLSREGEPTSEPASDIYGNLFVAEGLAEYSVASGKDEYWEKAKRMVLRCVETYDREDYLPEIGRTYLGPDARPFPGARILGHWMVLLRASTQMLRNRQDAELSKLADRCVDAILNYHHNPDFDLTNELIDPDLTRPNNEYARLVYTGHAIETLWMLMDEALRRQDETLFEEAARRFRRHVEVAWDDVYGGVFRNLQDVDANVWSLDKVLWAQEEVLIGALMMLEQTGAPWAEEIFAKMYRYVDDKFSLEQYGYPIWMGSADRKAQFEEHAERVENYHTPRHLMLNLLALDRMKNA